jgi:hypothetical protein
VGQRSTVIVIGLNGITVQTRTDTLAAKMHFANVEELALEFGTQLGDAQEYRDQSQAARSQLERIRPPFIRFAECMDDKMGVLTAEQHQSLDALLSVTHAVYDEIADAG